MTSRSLGLALLVVLISILGFAVSNVVGGSGSEELDLTPSSTPTSQERPEPGSTLDSVEDAAADPVAASRADANQLQQVICIRALDGTSFNVNGGANGDGLALASPVFIEVERHPVDAAVASGLRGLSMGSLDYRRVPDELTQALGRDVPPLFIEESLRCVFIASPDFHGDRPQDAALRVVTSPNSLEVLARPLEDSVVGRALELHHLTEEDESVPFAVFQRGPSSRVTGHLRTSNSGWAAFGQVPEDPAELLHLSEAGSISVTVRSYRPAPDLELQLLSEGGLRLCGRSLSEELVGTKYALEFVGLLPGTYEVRIADRHGRGGDRLNSAVSVRSGVVSLVEFDLAEQVAKTPRLIDLEIELCDTYQHLKLLTNQSVYYYLEPASPIVKAHEFIQFDPRSFSKMELLPQAGFVYSEQLDVAIPDGEYIVHVLPFGPIGSILASDDAPSTQRVVGPTFIDARVSYEIAPGSSSKKVRWSAGQKFGDNFISIPLTRTGDREFSLYCAQGDLVLTGIDESNQVQRFPLEIEAPNASRKVTWKSKPFCDIALFKAGSPWYTPIDNWGEAVVVDAAGVVAPRAMTATERSEDRSGVHAVRMWIEEPGEYRVELPLAGAGVSLTGTCTFDAAGGTGRIDVD